MHPSRDELIRYIRSLRSAETIDSLIETHVKECEFCRDFCANFTMLLEEEVKAFALDLSESISAAGFKIGHATGRILPLQPMKIETGGENILLAADSERAAMGGASRLLFSENPDLVMRIVPTADGRGNALQVTASEESLAAHLLLEAPQVNRSFVTDEFGRIVIATDDLSDPAALTWQIRIPDAVFVLKPLVFDPDAPRSSRESELNTPEGDRIRVRLTDHQEGLSIALQIISLHGRQELQKVKVLITQPGFARIEEQSMDQTLTFGALNPKQDISLRIFESL